MPKILITGICGMIGAVLSRYFLDKGYIVGGVDNLSEGYSRNLDSRTHFFCRSDICNLKGLDAIFKSHKPTHVIHLAAEAAEILSPFIRSFTYNTNIVGTANVIDCCVNHDVERLISFSSVARYGKGPVPFKETDMINPLEPYAFSKVLNEWDLKEAYEHFGLKYNVIVPFNVASHFQNFYSLYRNAIAIFIRQTINNENITIYGPGDDTFRSFSDAQFICEPIEKLLFAGDKFVGEAFNLGSVKPVSILNMAHIVLNKGRELGFHNEIIHLEPRREVKVAYCSTTKAQQLLGFKDSTNLQDLVSRMFDAAIRQPKEVVKKREYEITKGLYPYWR